MDYTRNPQNVLFTCNGRIFHYSLCSVELSEFLKTPVDALDIHAHLLDTNMLKILSKLPEQAEKQHSELFDPLIHPWAAIAPLIMFLRSCFLVFRSYRSGQAQLQSLYSQSLVVDIESKCPDCAWVLCSILSTILSWLQISGMVYDINFYNHDFDATRCKTHAHHSFM